MVNIADVIIPGHMREDMPLDESSLEFMEQYLAEVLLGGREWNWNENPDPKWLEIPVAWPDDPGIYV